MTLSDLHFSHQIISTLFSVTNRLQSQGDAGLRDLSVRQMTVMAALIHLPPDTANINTVARILGVSKQSAKQMVEVMEKKQVIRTAPSARDRRAVTVAITPRGEEVNRLCAERINHFAADIFRDFSREELETLLALLKKIRFEGETEGFTERLGQYADFHE